MWKKGFMAAEIIRVGRFAQRDKHHTCLCAYDASVLCSKTCPYHMRCNPQIVILLAHSFPLDKISIPCSAWNHPEYFKCHISQGTQPNIKYPNIQSSTFGRLSFIGRFSIWRWTSCFWDFSLTCVPFCWPIAHQLAEPILGFKNRVTTTLGIFSNTMGRFYTGIVLMKVFIGATIWKLVL